MLAHRLRRWPNISPTLGQRLVFAGWHSGSRTPGQLFPVLCTIISRGGAGQHIASRGCCPGDSRGNQECHFYENQKSAVIGFYQRHGGRARISDRTDGFMTTLVVRSTACLHYFHKFEDGIFNANFSFILLKKNIFVYKL